MRIAAKPVFAMSKNIDAGKKDSDQADAEKNPERHRNIAEFMSCFRQVHIALSRQPRELS